MSPEGKPDRFEQNEETPAVVAVDPTAKTDFERQVSNAAQEVEADKQRTVSLREKILAKLKAAFSERPDTRAPERREDIYFRQLEEEKKRSGDSY